MKREKIYCLLSAFVISILLSILTFEFTSLDATNVILIYLPYFTSTSAVFVSILAIIKNKKSKANKYGLLATINALIAILSFIFALFGTIQEIKNIAYIIFVPTFVILGFFCGLWSKYEKEEKIL